jgi:AbrB family looped-hinge helix DNA binding protein
MATTVGAGGRVVLPKSVREAAGICPGDRVSVRARAEGGVIIERLEPSDADKMEYLRRLEDMSRRKPFDGFTTEEVMASTRSEVTSADRRE